MIVGLGNELARDDGVGIVVARRLESLLRGRPDVEVLQLPWAGFALLDALVGRSRGVIIDCLTTGRHPPGRVLRLNESDFRGSVRLHSFHDINYPTALALGRAMGWTIPEDIRIWGVEGDVVDEFGVGLTPPVRAAANQVVHEVLRHLDAVACERPQARLAGAER